MGTKKKSKETEEDIEEPKPDEEIITKSDISDWVGGLPIDLKKKMKSGNVLKDELAKHIKDTLEMELKNQEGYINQLRKWNRFYDGDTSDRIPAFPGGANVFVPITRSDTVAVYVRVKDALFNKRKLWMVSTEYEDYVDQAKDIEEAINIFADRVLQYRKKVAPAMFQCVKTGTGIKKIVYEDKKKTVYRYATEEEEKDKEIKKYKLAGTKSKAVKFVESTYKGPNIYPVDRKDFVISTDATSIQEAYLVGFRAYFRKMQLKLKVKQGIYEKEAVDKMLTDKFDESKEEKALMQGKDIKKTPYEEPYEVWELWTKYDVDDDGEEDEIVVNFHRGSGQILRSIYNPLFSGQRPFSDFRGNTTDYVYDGDGVCKPLEKPQEEINSLHNMRLDRLSQINHIIALVKTGSGIDDFEPNAKRVWFINDDPERVINFQQFPDIYPSTEREEDRLTALCDRISGNTPTAQGISTAERPVARETLVLQEESNKIFKDWIDNIRDGVTEDGYQIIETFAQYQPTYTYTDEMGAEQVVTFPTGRIRDIFKVKLAASSEQMNQEARRQVNLTKYQLLSDFMTKQAGMAQALVSPQTPSDFKKLLIEANNIGVEILNKVLDDFDEPEHERLVLDATKVMDTEALVAKSIDLQPPSPQGGPPPQGASQGPPQQPPQQGPQPGGPEMMA